MRIRLDGVGSYQFAVHRIPSLITASRGREHRPFDELGSVRSPGERFGAHFNFLAAPMTDGQSRTEKKTVERNSLIRQWQQRQASRVRFQRSPGDLPVV
jgi:hypothetical protein